MPRGWCPSVHAPMPTGDGLLARIKPRHGGFPAAAAGVIAAAARVWAGGGIEITARANLQVRGLRPEWAKDFAAAMVACGAALADPGWEARRSILVSPLTGADPAAAADTAAAADAIEAGLAGASVPAKFTALVDGGGVWPLAGFAATIERRLGSAGAEAVEGTPVGFVPLGDGASGAMSFAAPQGEMRAEALAALATAAGLHDGMVRVTPWRTLVLAGVAAEAVPGLIDLGARFGLITAADDPRLRVVACPGAPGCASGAVPARADAARLAALIGPAGPLVHVSGCAKGCAHRDRAPVVLTGREGRYDLAWEARAGAAPAARGLTVEAAAALIRARAA
jgi:precorrin-3B synthase